ncbi:MAG: esterase/lipase family protein [Methylococcales bacterium]
MHNMWLREPRNGATVVFVHGILSNSASCWQQANGCTWPGLLKNEQELEDWGIYVYGYETGIFSGTYSLNDVVDDLKERFFNLDKVAENRRIVFVCHSMGGIAVRKFLVERVNDLLDRDIQLGLFLVASPSLGSSYANWLTQLARFMGHTQADALRFTQENTWLNGLDKEFQNLKESGRLKMSGKELIEDKFVVLQKIWHKQVVEPFAGARYFGEPYKVPGSDHFSIAKPKDSGAVQHRLLVAFIKSFNINYIRSLAIDRTVSLTNRVIIATIWWVICGFFPCLTLVIGFGWTQGVFLSKLYPHFFLFPLVIGFFIPFFLVPPLRLSFSLISKQDKARKKRQLFYWPVLWLSAQHTLRGLI